MKEKRIVEYIKNGEKETTNFNILTAKNIYKNIFEEPYYQSGDEEIYKIKDDIEYLKINNITFKKNLKIITPPNTTVILNKCQFLGERIDLIKGDIKIYYPELNPSIYINQIHALSLNNLDIITDSNNKGFIAIAGNINNFKINAQERIETLVIEGETALLENIKEIRNIKLTNTETTIKNSNFIIDSSKHNIMTTTLNIENSSLHYQDGKAESQPTIKTNELNLINTTIDTNSDLNIYTKSIKMDEESNLKAKNKLKILNDIFKNQNKDIEINLKNKKEINKTHELITTLKGIKELLEEEKNTNQKAKNNRR